MSQAGMQKAELNVTYPNVLLTGETECRKNNGLELFL